MKGIMPTFKIMQSFWKASNRFCRRRLTKFSSFWSVCSNWSILSTTLLKFSFSFAAWLTIWFDTGLVAGCLTLPCGCTRSGFWTAWRGTAVRISVWICKLPALPRARRSRACDILVLHRHGWDSHLWHLCVWVLLQRYSLWWGCFIWKGITHLTRYRKRMILQYTTQNCHKHRTSGINSRARPL